ncbi:hypothetical protein [Helicobacter anatolicus]|nr:hypothetical protein [Helicobacter anatolicus]
MSEIILFSIFVISIAGFFFAIKPKKDKNCGCSQGKSCKTKKY